MSPGCGAARGVGRTHAVPRQNPACSPPHSPPALADPRPCSPPRSPLAPTDPRPYSPPRSLPAPSDPRPSSPPRSPPRPLSPGPAPLHAHPHGQPQPLPRGQQHQDVPELRCHPAGRLQFSGPGSSVCFCGEDSSGPGSGGSRRAPRGTGPHVPTHRALFCRLAAGGAPHPDSPSCRLPGTGAL